MIRLKSNKSESVNSIAKMDNKGNEVENNHMLWKCIQ